MPSEISARSAKAATLADFTREDLIIPRLREGDMPGIISELSHLLHRHGCISDCLPFYHAALNQEFLIGAPGAGLIALPHARSSGVKSLRFALGRSDRPVQWSQSGTREVRLVFLIAIPATNAGTYLLLLSRLARLGTDRAAVEELCSLQSAAETHGWLQQRPLTATRRKGTEDF